MQSKLGMKHTFHLYMAVLSIATEMRMLKIYYRKKWLRILMNMCSICTMQMLHLLNLPYIPEKMGLQKQTYP